MRKVSLKRQKENRDWPSVRAAVMERDGWECQLQTALARHGGALIYFAHGCQGELDPHHIVTVARDSKLRLEPDNLVVLCRAAHDWVHSHIPEATLLGLLKSAPAAGAPCPEAPR